jgi:hypothetical protein
MEQNEIADSPGLGDRLDLADAVAVDHWAKLLGLTACELKEAVAAVGPEYGDLVAHLADKPGKPR